MEEQYLTNEILETFEVYLIKEEKSAATVEKYMRDCRAFLNWAKHVGKEAQDIIITKEMLMNYKKHLQDGGYAVTSINSMLASLNALLQFKGWSSCKVKNVRAQRQIYMRDDKNLTREEYMRLLKAAEGNQRLAMVLQTICATGIRVSELKYFTVEAVRVGEIRVNCKNKTRTILIPGKLKKMLKDYARKQKILQGPIFVTRTGNVLDRSNIWAQMKGLCKAAAVLPSKVFPHNLRKLFAKTFYKVSKDMARLADVLGHSSVDTTRIYIMTTGHEQQRLVERLNLVYTMT